MEGKAKRIQIAKQAHRSLICRLKEAVDAAQEAAQIYNLISRDEMADAFTGGEMTQITIFLELIADEVNYEEDTKARVVFYDKEEV